MVKNVMDFITEELIEEMLGYSAENEAALRQECADRFRAERAAITAMSREEAKKTIETKKRELRVASTTEAAVLLGTTTNRVLSLVRKGALHGFKPDHGHWRVFITKDMMEHPSRYV